MITYLRTNGILRLLYLGGLHLIYLVSIRSYGIAERLLLLPIKKKLIIAIIFLAVCALIIFGFKLWLLAPLVALPLFFIIIIALAYTGKHPIFRFIYWSIHKQRILDWYPGRYSISISSLGLNKEELRNLQADIEKNNETIIANIDKDGFLLSRYGQFAGGSFTDQKSFIPRKRNKIQLVAVGDLVGVKKPSATMKGFLTEIDALFTLRKNCNVPAILDVDLRKYTLIVSFIPGVVLGEELAKRGARTRHRDLASDQEYHKLSKAVQKRKRLESSRPILNEYAGPHLKEELFSELKKIHKSGVIVNDLKYGNLVIEKDTEKPFFIDFDFAQNVGFPGGLRGEVRRDSEIRLFNDFFDMNKPTRNSLVETINNIHELIPETEQVSAIIGRGLCFGRTWDVTFGEGLWNFILEPHLPEMTDLRILDISGMDPLYSLRMLLNGAAEVIRIRDNDKWEKYTRFLKEAFEWVNSTTLNLLIENTTMRDLPGHQLDPFDLLFSNESIFHNKEQDLEQIIKYYRSVGIKTIISCIRHADAVKIEHFEHTSHNSSFNILDNCGFRIVEDISRKGSNQRLLIFKLLEV